ncbi:MAG: hypothetical protein WA280_19565, partial [Xanthobacteraceae bacterium]
GVDFAEFLAGDGGFARDLGFGPVPAATPRRLAFLGAGGTIGATAALARFRPYFPARLLAPLVFVVFVISGPHRLAVIAVVVLSDDLVEPFSDRYPGAARGIAGGFARFWTEASEIPRTARFHLCAKPLREEREGPVLSGGSLNRRSGGRSRMSSGRTLQD